ncbi:MAG: gluconokinase [Anaerolineae bacterium]
MFVILMGVSGSGKTTIGKKLAAGMACRFYDGDDFHPPENVAKMAAGAPLNDNDRAGWLAALAGLIRAGIEKDECGVIACSALKEKYRAALRVDAERVRFVYLRGSYDVILGRMQSRKEHYMKPGMLASQFEALEEPQDALVEDITLAPDVIVRDIMDKLGSNFGRGAMLRRNKKPENKIT